MLYHDPRTSPGHLFYDVLEREEWQNTTGCYSLTFSVEENWRAGGQAQIIFDGDNSLAGRKRETNIKAALIMTRITGWNIDNETL